ncbi:MAG TPA: DUF4157 domain-containing protein [Gemmatimonadaceae bacterium]|nr:DUF4157 domain-containing protein [Gemmatimonadaceae bacterium]
MWTTFNRTLTEAPVLAPRWLARRATRQPASRAPSAERAAARRGPLDGLLALARRAGNAALGRLATADGDVRGAPIDGGTASRLSAAYGVELHDVRVVDDRDSHAAARAIDAQAFAADGSVYLGDRAPAAGTPARDALLAHELAHVAQQAKASALVYGEANAPGDAHERAADRAAAAARTGAGAHFDAAGAPAAVQRQPVAQSIRKSTGLSRADAQKVLESYFARLPRSPGSTGVLLTENAKNDIRKIGLALRDPGTIISLDAFVAGNMLATSPADLAKRIAGLLPEIIDPAALAHLGGAEGEDRAATSPDSTRFNRLVDLAKKTSPEVGDEAKEQQWKFDQNVSSVRERDKPVLGPLKSITPSLDLERIYNIAKGLPKAWKGEKRDVQPRSYPAVDAEVAKLSPASLIPRAARGTKDADAYANAQYLASSLANDLDVAQQKKQFSVRIDIGANYRTVDDSAELIDEVERIVRLIVKALPHHASQVGQVEIYIGSLRVRVVSLGGGQ